MPKLRMEFSPDDLRAIVAEHVRTTLPFRLVEDEEFCLDEDGASVSIETKSVGDMIEESMEVDDFASMEVDLMQAQDHIDHMHAEINILETDLGTLKARLNEIAHIIGVEDEVPVDDSIEGWSHAADVISQSLRRSKGPSPSQTPNTSDDIRPHIQ